jgi:transcriptional regulator GlxA family with amidase domain
MTEQPNIIVIIGFEGNTALDLVGAADTFNTASYLNQPRPYRVITASVDGRCFSSEGGLKTVPDCRLDEVEAIDTLIVPGGAGLREPVVAAPMVAWIKANHQRIRRIASVCTGLFGLAATGLMDGRRAATHWRFAERIAALHPAIDIDPDAIFVRDGKFITSAGVTAGIDLALALIEEDLGPAAALAVARELVVFVKRPGGQSQFSDFLRFEAASAPRLRDFGIISRPISTPTSASRSLRPGPTCPSGISRGCSRGRSACRRRSSSSACAWPKRLAA